MYFRNRPFQAMRAKIWPSLFSKVCLKAKKGSLGGVKMCLVILGEGCVGI